MESLRALPWILSGLKIFFPLSGNLLFIGSVPDTPIESILETCLYVNDLEAAARFYGGVLGLNEHSRQAGKFVFFHVGSGMLLIFNPDASRGGAHDLPDHGAAGVEHVAFAVAEDSLDSWRAHLLAQGVGIEQDHLWPHGRRSLYFRDPAGHSIELASTALWH